MEPSLSSIFFQPAGLLSACLVFSRKGPTVQLAALAGEFCMVNVSTLMITMSGGHPLGVTLQPSVMLSRMHSSVIYSTAADLLITWRSAVMLTCWCPVPSHVGLKSAEKERSSNKPRRSSRPLARASRHAPNGTVRRELVVHGGNKTRKYRCKKPAC